MTLVDWAMMSSDRAMMSGDLAMMSGDWATTGRDPPLLKTSFAQHKILTELKGPSIPLALHAMLHPPKHNARSQNDVAEEQEGQHPHKNPCENLGL